MPSLACLSTSSCPSCVSALDCSSAFYQYRPRRRLWFRKVASNSHVEATATSSPRVHELDDFIVSTVQLEANATPSPRKKSFGFFAIIVALSISGLLSALEATMTSTALPTIIADVGGDSGGLYVWAINGFYMSQTVVQPLTGQLANIYGRRWPMLISVAIFILGCGLGGGATSITMLVIARLIQGLGSGGLNVLLEIIICDLVPLRERGKYLGILFGIIGIGSACGPLFGGLIVQKISWRWVFYINLPVGGAALSTLFLFLKVKSDKTLDYYHRLTRIDWIGNLIFVCSIVAVLVAFSWAGTTHPWSSFRVLLPLVSGLVGIGVFILYEGSPFCSNPTMPLHHFANRTSATAMALTFLSSLIFVMMIYFLPIYFQAVLEDSPTDSGTHILPTIFSLALGAIASGQLMSKFGRYRPLHHAGFALLATGFGLLLLLSRETSTVKWVGLQIPGGLGIGIILPILLPAVQASLKDSDIALSTSTWTFIRGVGQILGSTLPIVAFDNSFNRHLRQIQDPSIASQLVNGQAYQRATRDFILSIIDPVVRGEVQSVYVDAIKIVWWMGLAFSILGFVLVMFEKEVKLREEVDPTYGQEAEREGR